MKVIFEFDGVLTPEQVADLQSKVGGFYFICSKPEERLQPPVLLSEVRVETTE